MKRDDPRNSPPSEDTYAQQREAHLQADAQTWDTTQVMSAQPGDIPVIDISGIKPGANTPEQSGRLSDIVRQLATACRNVGFYSLIGHGIESAAFAEIFASARCFHALPLDQKMALAMDREGKPAGAGYLPVQHRKLPRRAQGNANEAFIVKRDQGLSFADNQWPGEAVLPGFQASVLKYAASIEALALRLLPLYAQALGVSPDFFTTGFRDPLLRLRLTHYPPVQAGLDENRGSSETRVSTESSSFGIAPHVDTTFFTLLAQEQPGLVVFSERRQGWIAVPKVDNALVVNTGELLKQWSNDEFISVKHFANNVPANGLEPNGLQSRYSVPLFFNATSDYPMECLPSCCGPDRPRRYPTISYNQSQGVIQGE